MINYTGLLPYFKTFFFIPLLFISCKKDIKITDPVQIPELTITGVKPNTGMQGDTIIITGTHFNTNPLLDSVKINGVESSVHYATTDSLYVIVPLASSGAVTVNGVRAPGEPFIYSTRPALTVITDVKPGYGKQGDTVLIIGKNFKPYPDEDTVTINAVRVPVLKSSSDTLYVVVPLTSTGILMVNGVAAPGQPFIYAPTVFVTTLAGNGVPGFANGPNSIAEFNYPSALCFDKQGSLFVVDRWNNCIRKISDGFVSTYAGNGLGGILNGPNLTAEFINLFGMTSDPSGNIYVTEPFYTQKIRKISETLVSDYAGSDIRLPIGDPNPSGIFLDPGPLTSDQLGNLYVGEAGDIQKVSPGGEINILAGKFVTWGIYDSASGRAGILTHMGYIDGPDTTARFGQILSMTSDDKGNIYLADNGCDCIRKITPQGLVSTFIKGNAEYFPFVGDNLSTHGICVDKTGNVFITHKNSILQITPGGKISKLAGGLEPGYLDGPTELAAFSGPAAIAIDMQGNLVIADAGNFRIRKITFQ